MPLLMMSRFFQSLSSLFGTHSSARRSNVQASYSPADSPIVGRWNLRTYLGSGNMAEVWLAEDTKQGGMVALKILPKHLQQDGELQRRFEEEIRNLRYLTSPDSPESLSTYLGDGLTEAQNEYQVPVYCLAMRYIGGEALDPDGRLLRSFDLEERLAILRSVAKAIAYIHARGIQHRDIKPENIRVDANGNAVLTDLGIAKSEETDLRLTTVGRIGSIAYMSSQGADDIYAFAVTAYEILCDGKHPFGNINRMTEIELRQKQQGFLPDRPTWIDRPSQRLRANWQPAVENQKTAFNRLFAKALSNNPDDRPKTIADFMKSLDQVVDPTEVAPDPLFSTRQGLIVVGVVMLFLVAFGLFALISGNADDGDNEATRQQAVSGGAGNSNNESASGDAGPTNPADVLRTIIGTQEDVTSIPSTDTAVSNEQSPTASPTPTTTVTLTQTAVPTAPPSPIPPSETTVIDVTNTLSPTSTRTPRPSPTRTRMPTAVSTTNTPSFEPATSLSALMNEFLDVGDYLGRIDCAAFTLAYDRLIDRLEADDPEFQAARSLIDREDALLIEIDMLCDEQGNTGPLILQPDDRSLSIQDEFEALRDG